MEEDHLTISTPAAESDSRRNFSIIQPCATLIKFGLWRSLVARLLGVQEVPGSNPGSPTKVFKDL